MFSVVMAEEDHREALARYLRRRVDAPDCPPSFVTSYGRHVTLDGGGPLHVDDQVLPAQGPVSIRVDPAALEVLV